MFPKDANVYHSFRTEEASQYANVEVGLGIMHARCDSSNEETYQKMYDAYCAIFSRMGLDFRAVIADSGSIGGNHSHEFHVLAASGEDDIAFSSDSDYAANVEMAQAVAPEKATPSGAAVETKDAKGKDFNAILKSVEADVTKPLKLSWLKPLMNLTIKVRKLILISG